MTRDDIWQCRHSREGCDSDEACAALNHEPQDIRADEREPLRLSPALVEDRESSSRGTGDTVPGRSIGVGATPLRECIAEQVWPELGDVQGYEQYKREMENVAPWNEGIE